MRRRLSCGDANVTLCLLRPARQMGFYLRPFFSRAPSRHHPRPRGRVSTASLLPAAAPATFAHGTLCQELEKVAQSCFTLPPLSSTINPQLNNDIKRFLTGGRRAELPSSFSTCQWVITPPRNSRITIVISRPSNVAFVAPDGKRH